MSKSHGLANVLEVTGDLADAFKKAMFGLKSHRPELDQGSQLQNCIWIVHHEVVLRTKMQIGVQLKEQRVMLINDSGQVGCSFWCKRWRENKFHAFQKEEQELPVLVFFRDEVPNHTR